MMKRILTVLLVLLASLAQAQTTALDEIFERYQEAKGVTSIKIAKPMFSMLGKMNFKDSELSDLQPLLSKMNSLKMLIVEGDGQAALKAQLKQAFAGIHFEELMSVNSDGNRIKFLTQNSADSLINNLVLDISDEQTSMFMILDGQLKSEDLNNLLEGQ